MKVQKKRREEKGVGRIPTNSTGHASFLARTYIHDILNEEERVRMTNRRAGVTTASWRSKQQRRFSDALRCRPGTSKQILPAILRQDVRYRVQKLLSVAILQYDSG